MLKKIFQPKVCVALIITLLMVSVCVSPFAGIFFMENWFGPIFNTSVILVVTPILLGIIYAILISIETEPEKPSEKRKNGFAIAYACIFTLFFVIDIWAIIYTIITRL